MSGDRPTGPRTPYRPKNPPNASVSLTKLAKRILEAASRRCGESKSDIVEHLIRTQAGKLSHADFEQLNAA